MQPPDAAAGVIDGQLLDELGRPIPDVSVSQIADLLNSRVDVRFAFLRRKRIRIRILCR